MANLTCPSCGKYYTDAEFVHHKPSDEHILCLACQEAAQRAKVEREIIGHTVNLHTPPSTMWHRQSSEHVSVGKATGPNKSLWFLIPFTISWVTAGAYFTSMMLDTALFFGVFGFVGFTAAAVLLIAFTMMAVAGRVELSIDGEDVNIFTGVGRFGWNRHFLLSQMEQISHKETLTQYVDGKTQRTRSIDIRLQSDGDKSCRNIKFGVIFLDDTERDYVVGMLMKLHEALPKTSHLG